MDRAGRWRLSMAVRRAMAGSTEDSLLRRAHRVVRKIPGVQQVWRLIDRNSHLGWLEVSRYAARGGQFGRNEASTRNFPTPADFESDAFFTCLLDRILACEPRLDRVEDMVVLVNNGLSAGGAERQIVATMTGLKSRGQRAVFIGERLTGIPGQDFHLAAVLASGIDARPLPRTIVPGLSIYAQISRPVAEQLARMPPEMLLEILEMAALLRDLRPRALHLWQDETSIKHAISGLIAGVPRIVLASRNVNPTFFSYHQLYMRRGYLALMKAPGVVLCNNSHAGAQSYGDWLGIDPKLYRVVHNGFDPSRLEAANDVVRLAARRSLGVEPGTPLVLGVFRLSHEKQPLLWVEVAAETLKLAPQTCFVIAGEGPMRRDVVERIRDLRVSDRVQLAGAQREIGHLYVAADAFLLTSEYEGLPNVLLEAQWYGRPVLATAAGGSTEAIVADITGRITQSGAAADIAADLAVLLADAELQRRAATAGPEHVLKSFGLDRMIDQTLALYGCH